MTPNLPRYRHVRAGIPGYPKCHALLSAANPGDVKRAVVFVHGFNGSSVGTWADFYSLVDDDAYASRWWQDADLFFYHYQWNSVFRRIARNASGVYRFVKSLFPPDPKLFSEASMSERKDFVYDELFLIGHSEGGLLLRHVILQAAKEDKRLDAYHFDKTLPEPLPLGLLKGQLRLFAPAIAGESLTGLAGLLARLPVIEHGISLFTAKKGMAPQGTPVAIARAYTDKKTAEFRMECFRAHILWSDDDKIVDEGGYEQDYECPDRPPNTKHTSVCKPTTEYPLPVTFVEKGTNGGCQ